MSVKNARDTQRRRPKSNWLSPLFDSPFRPVGPVRMACARRSSPTAPPPRNFSPALRRAACCKASTATSRAPCLTHIFTHIIRITSLILPYISSPFTPLSQALVRSAGLEMPSPALGGYTPLLGVYGVVSFLRNAVLLTSSSFILIVFIVVGYRLFLHPLARVPGPRLAAISNVWHAYHVRNGRMLTLGKTLHKRYGPVVRVGPNEVWFDSVDAFKHIYRMLITPHERCLISCLLAYRSR